MTLFISLAMWLLLSFPAGVVLGRWLAASQPDHYTDVLERRPAQA